MADPFRPFRMGSKYHEESRDSVDAQSVHALSQPPTLPRRQEKRENSHGDSHRQDAGEGLAGAAGRGSVLGSVQTT